MAKSARGRRRTASSHHRTTPYPHPHLACRHVSGDLTGKPKDWEDITCSVCMEYPHNAVLLLCSSHNKGCRPYMCGTSSRYSNCLDQYKAHHHPPPPPATGGGGGGSPPPPVEKIKEGAELACPLCRGQVKGWTVVESAREYLNLKKRSCMHDECSFVGVYKELKKHVREVHPSAKPREVDPDQEQKWRRLEQEREREDVISTVTSSMPGSVVFGDYVIERNPYGLDSDDDDGLGNVGINNNFMNMLLLFHAFGHGGDTRVLDADDDEDDDDDGGGGGDGMSLVSRLRRQGRVILGRSGRRRRRRRLGGER
ncbi:hypothetical protein Lser_V15G46098 [Lactuca serriola]